MRQILYTLVLIIGIIAVVYNVVGKAQLRAENTELKTENATLKAQLATAKAEHTVAELDAIAASKPADGTAARMADEPSRQDTVLTECMKATQTPTWKQEFAEATTPIVSLASMKKGLEDAQSQFDSCDVMMLEFASNSASRPQQFPVTAVRFSPEDVTKRHRQITLTLGRTMADIATFQESIPSDYFAYGELNYYPRHHVVKDVMVFLEEQSLKPEEVKSSLTGKILAAAFARGIKETIEEWDGEGHGGPYRSALQTRLCDEQEVLSAEQIKKLGCTADSN